LDLNLFENREKDNNNFIEKFIQELRDTLINFSNNKHINNDNQNLQKNNNEKEINIDTKYDLYEKRKIFLDNKSRNGNDLAWITDQKSACISEHGDGGSYFMDELDLPQNVKIR